MGCMFAWRGYKCCLYPRRWRTVRAPDGRTSGGLAGASAGRAAGIGVGRAVAGLWVGSCPFFVCLGWAALGVPGGRVRRGCWGLGVRLPGGLAGSCCVVCVVGLVAVLFVGGVGQVDA